MNKKLKELERNIKQIEIILKEIDYPKKILEKEIKPFGNSNHIILPKKYKNKKAKIIIKR